MTYGELLLAQSWSKPELVVLYKQSGIRIITCPEGSVIIVPDKGLPKAYQELNTWGLPIDLRQIDA